MKRWIVVVEFFAMAALLLAAAPRKSFAETVSCTEQYSTCINNASQFRDSATLLTMAEAECGIQYEGCVIRKLKFW